MHDDQFSNRLTKVLKFEMEIRMKVKNFVAIRKITLIESISRILSLILLFTYTRKYLCIDTSGQTKSTIYFYAFQILNSFNKTTKGKQSMETLI